MSASANQERELLASAVKRCREWLCDNCTGEPPRMEVALLATLAEAVGSAGQATERLWFVHDVLHNCRAMLSDQDGAHAEIGRAMGMLRAAAHATPETQPPIRTGGSLNIPDVVRRAAGQVIPEPPAGVEKIMALVDDYTDHFVEVASQKIPFVADVVVLKAKKNAIRTALAGLAP